MCSKKYLDTKSNDYELRFSNLVFHNFKMIIFHNKKTLSLNLMFLCIIIFQEKHSQSIFSQNTSLFLLICFGDRSSHQRCSAKKLLIKYLQNSQEINYKFFPVNIAKCLRTPISKNICERLLLPLGIMIPLLTSSNCPVK